MKTLEIIESLEMNYGEIKLTSSDKKEIKAIYKDVSEDYEDLDEFRLFEDIKKATDWVVDDKEQAYSLVNYMANKLSESKDGEYKMNISDLLDDRYHRLSSGKVVVNLEY